jgi:hypothetical protein
MVSGKRACVNRRERTAGLDIFDQFDNDAVGICHFRVEFVCGIGLAQDYGHNDHPGTTS